MYDVEFQKWHYDVQKKTNISSLIAAPDWSWILNFVPDIQFRSFRRYRRDFSITDEDRFDWWDDTSAITTDMKILRMEG